MGENLEEAQEFDRRMQSVAEGTYHPSHSAMETFPVRYNIRSEKYIHICTQSVVYEVPWAPR